MRKLLLLPPVLLALAYVAWPAWSAFQLRAAVKARDLPGIEARVDWPQLRANLKKTIAANLTDDDKNADAGFLARTLKRTLGPMVANRVIDATVTPRTLAHVMSGRLLTREIARDIPGATPDSTPDDEEAIAAADPLSPRRLRWAFFESPARFRIEVVDPKEPGKRVVSILALQGLSWKLVDVYYRTLD
jgi:Protein of unknown function (DUF2939)